MKHNSVLHKKAQEYADLLNERLDLILMMNEGSAAPLDEDQLLFKYFGVPLPEEETQTDTGA